VIYTPGHSPGPRDLLGPRSRRRFFPATSSFRGRSAGPISPVGLAGPCFQSIDTLIERPPARTRRLPGHMGITTLQSRARRRTRSCASSRSADPGGPMIQAPKGTFDVLPEDAERRALVEAHARRILGAAGYQRIETPTFEATELFARGVGQATDIVQKEMLHVRRRRWPLRDAQARRHRSCVPRVHRARNAQAPAAGEALVRVELLSERGAAKGSLPPVLAGRGGGNRVSRAGARRRADRVASPSCSRPSGSRTSACDSRASARPRPAPSIARS